MRQARHRFAVGVSAGVLGAFGMSGCGASSVSTYDLGSIQQAPTDWDPSVPGPPSFTGRTFDADLLVLSTEPLPASFVRRVADASSVRRSASLSLFSLPTGGRTVTVAAGKPEALRAFSPAHLAAMGAAWQRLADGQAILNEATGLEASTPGGDLFLDGTGQLPPIEVAVIAELPLRADLLVNLSWADALGAPLGNALLLEAPDAEHTVDSLRRRLLGRAQVISLASASEAPVLQPALLTGGAVAEAVGSFTYRPRPDGSIVIDPAWISEHIVTREVPILGRVTCHRVMLPQLRGAMQELIDRGLAGLIRPEQYGGCWVPRFIANDPSRGLSLHSWGIALDLNVPTNLRGTRGDMDPRVVAVMESWGFAWGGTWSDPDPMHFELAALRAAR